MGDDTDLVPDDAGLGESTEAPLRRYTAVVWLLVAVSIVFVIVVSGTYGASLLTGDAQLGSPDVVVEIDGTPTVAYVAGDFAVGAKVTEDRTYLLFGATAIDVTSEDGA